MPRRGAKVLRCRTDLAIDLLLRATPYDPSPLLQNISATTLLRGEEDMIATAAHHGYLKDGIAGAELVSFLATAKISIGENPRT